MEFWSYIIYSAIFPSKTNNHFISYKATYFDDWTSRRVLQTFIRFFDVRNREVPR